MLRKIRKSGSHQSVKKRGRATIKHGKDIMLQKAVQITQNYKKKANYINGHSTLQSEDID